MTAPLVLVSRSEDRWEILFSNDHQVLASDCNAVELARAIREACDQHDVRRARVVLGLSANDCFFVRLDDVDQLNLRNRQAMSYALEEHLPIDAESMVADFCEVATDESVGIAAVATTIRPWIDYVEAIEEQGIVVQAIVPRSILLAHAVAQKSGDQEFELFDFQGDHCNLVSWRAQRACRWVRSEVSVESMRRLGVLEPLHATKFMCGGDEMQQQVARDVFSEVADVEISSEELIASCHSYLRQGDNHFDLRRDALGHRDPLRQIRLPLRTAGVAIAVCFIAMIVGSWWRTDLVEQEISRIRQQQQREFEDAFPNARVPAALLRRVRSEHSKVLGSRGKTAAVEAPLEAPLILRQVLDSLPEKIRFQVQRIVIANGEVTMDLLVRNPVDSGTIAGALSEAGFDVEPPGTTQKDDRSYQSQLKAKWRPLPSSAQNSRASQRVQQVSRAIVSPEVSG